MAKAAEVETTGRSLRWQIAEVAARSLIREPDLMRAQKQWKAMVRPWARNLLTLAKWDKDVQQYALDGKAISDDDLRRLILLLVAMFEQELLEATGAMLAGETEIGAWQDAFALRLKDMHLMTWAAGFGGWANLDSKSLDLIAAILRYQYAKLEHFARQIEANWRTAVTEGQINGRVKLYAKSGVSSFEESRRRSHADAGFDKERNILGNAEHCPQCVQETEREWVPLGALVPVGERLCIYNCKCHLIYRKTSTNNE